MSTISEAISQLQSHPSMMIAFDDRPGPAISYASLFHTRKTTHDIANFEISQQNLPDKVAVLLFSSGTTGLPKAVQLTEQNILTAIAHVEYEYEFSIKWTYH